MSDADVRGLARCPSTPVAAATAMLLFAATAATAQVRIASGGAATLTGAVGGAVTRQTPQQAALVTVVNFGDVSPNNPSAYVCFTQPVKIWARPGSTMRLAVTAESFGSTPADIKKTDIGVGVVNVRSGGPNADVSTTSVVAMFAADPCLAPKDADGIPAFAGTLAAVGVAAPGAPVMISTGPISLRGSFRSNSNEADLDVKLAIAPQAFRAGNFSLTLTLTMTQP